MTVPDYEVRATKAIQLVLADEILWCPFVSEIQRTAWESYTVVQGPLWLRESLDAAGLEGESVNSFLPFIHNQTSSPVDGPVSTGNNVLSGLYAPVWYVSPILDLKNVHRKSVSPSEFIK